MNFKKNVTLHLLLTFIIVHNLIMGTMHFSPIKTPLLIAATPYNEIDILSISTDQNFRNNASL